MYLLGGFLKVDAKTLAVDLMFKSGWTAHPRDIDLRIHKVSSWGHLLREDFWCGLRPGRLLVLERIAIARDSKFDTSLALRLAFIAFDASDSGYIRNRYLISRRHIRTCRLDILF